MSNGSENTPENTPDFWEWLAAKQFSHGSEQDLAHEAWMASAVYTSENLRRRLHTTIEASYEEGHEAGYLAGQSDTADYYKPLQAERDALQDQLDAIRKYVRRVPFPKPDKILAILDPVEVKEEDK